jgi:hypothetical protein
LWRGRYHTDRQPGAALQNTAMCLAGMAPAGPAANCNWRRWLGAWGSVRADAGALACCGWGLAALARAVIMSAPVNAQASFSSYPAGAQIHR